MTHFLRYKNKGVIEKSLTSLISLTPPLFLFTHSRPHKHKFTYTPKTQYITFTFSFFTSSICSFFY